jgi:hypothetical protein
MKLPIIIEYSSGDRATYVAGPPEWAKWEKATDKTISDAAGGIGVWDLMFLAYNAHKRERLVSQLSLSIFGWKQSQILRREKQTQKPQARKFRSRLG